MSDLTSTLSALPGEASAFTPKPLPATQLHAKPSATYTAKLAETQALLQQAAVQFKANGQFTITQASSLGAEDVVITHLINKLGLDIPVFVLETGALHPETLELLQQTVDSSQAPVTIYKPDTEAVVQFVAREGADAMYKSIELRKACCGIRKMEPLARALAGKEAWITGLRRNQGTDVRSKTGILELYEFDKLRANHILKLNPMANWSREAVWDYIKANGIPYNPLHDRGYRTIGCWPCTKVAGGEGERAGRWEGFDKQECGIHTFLGSNI